MLVPVGCHAFAHPSASSRSPATDPRPQGPTFQRRRLLAAFGRLTADGTRHDGLRRADGRPLVQALLGSHDANQGLTLLRVQHVHLLEPHPKGWPEVVQATGRAVRRDTHAGLETARPAMWRVATRIYRATLGPAVAECRARQQRQMELEREEQTRDFQHYRDQIRRLEAQVAALGDTPEELARAECALAHLRKECAELSRLAEASAADRALLEKGWLRMETGQWLARQRAFKTQMLPTWEVRSGP